MKAKDLRIGNYFKWSIYASMGIGVDIITDKNHYSHNQLREPIPLTEDWLLKFGFEKDVDEVYYILIEIREKYFSKLRVFYNINRVMLDFNKTISSNIKHVHQLQNLYYSLCQKELQIKK